jgi:hypothetical protein
VLRVSIYMGDCDSVSDCQRLRKDFSARGGGGLKLAESSSLAVLDSDGFPTTQRISSVAQRITATLKTGELKFRGFSLLPGLLCRLVTGNSYILSILHSNTVTVIREHNNISHVNTNLGT